MKGKTPRQIMDDVWGSIESHDRTTSHVMNDAQIERTELRLRLLQTILLAVIAERLLQGTTIEGSVGGDGLRLFVG